MPIDFYPNLSTPPPKKKKKCHYDTRPLPGLAGSSLAQISCYQSALQRLSESQPWLLEAQGALQDSQISDFW